MTPDYLTLEMAAEYCSLSVSFLRRHLRADEPYLPHIRAGRKILIERAALARWLDLFADTFAEVENRMHDIQMARFRRDFPTAA